MTEKQEKLQKINNDVLKLLDYFIENFEEETPIIQRDLKSISAGLIELITIEIKNDKSNQQQGS